MHTVLQIDCPFVDPVGAELYAAMRPLAESISQELGVLWKIWTENAESQAADGVYLFTDATSGQNYLEKHSTRLTASGVSGIRVKLFAVNKPLSKICKGPTQ